MLTLTVTLLCEEGMAGVLIYLDSDAILSIEIAADALGPLRDALLSPSLTWPRPAARAAGG